MCCTRDHSRLLEPFCSAMEREAEALSVRVEKTATGLRFQVPHGGLMLDLYDAVRSFACKGRVARVIDGMRRNAAVYAQLALPLAGQTVPLADILKLKV